MVQVIGANNVALGQPLLFAIQVRNSSLVGPVSNVQVELPLPPAGRFLRSDPPAEVKADRLSWYLGNIEAAGQRRLAVQVMPSDAGPLDLRPVVRFSPPVGLRAEIVRPPFGVSVTAPETASVGGHITLQIVLSNNRNVPIQRIVLRDKLPPGLQHPQGKEVQAELGPLGPNEVKTIRLETTASTAGQQINEVVAWADYADGRHEAKSECVTQVAQPTLALSLDGPRSGALNEEIDFRLTLEVPGEGTAANVHLAQYLPEGLEFVSASTGGTYDAKQRLIVWGLGTLNAKQRANVTFKLRGKTAGDWALPAAGGATGMTEARTTRAIHLDAIPTLALELPPPNGPLDAGSETVYELRVANTGNVAATDVVVVVWLPAELQAVRGEGPSAARTQPQQVVFEPLAQLGPRADTVYRIRVRGTRAGQGRFRALLQANALPRPIVHEFTAQVRGTTPANLVPIRP
jgi:uncharacterized repeat protein (TIGR01451 family)